MSIDATPFFVAGASQIVGVGAQRLVDLFAQREYDIAINDENRKNYRIPPRLSKEDLSSRWTRDSDVLLAVLFIASFVATTIVDFESVPAAQVLVVAIGVLLPVLAIAVMLSIDYEKYAKATIFRRNFPITIFAYVAFSVSTFVGIVVACV